MLYPESGFAPKDRHHLYNLLRGHTALYAPYLAAVKEVREEFNKKGKLTLQDLPAIQGIFARQFSQPTHTLLLGGRSLDLLVVEIAKHLCLGLDRKNFRDGELENSGLRFCGLPAVTEVQEWQRSRGLLKDDVESKKIPENSSEEPHAEVLEEAAGAEITGKLNGKHTHHAPASGIQVESEYSALSKWLSESPKAQKQLQAVVQELEGIPGFPDQAEGSAIAYIVAAVNRHFAPGKFLNGVTISISASDLAPLKAELINILKDTVSNGRWGGHNTAFAERGIYPSHHVTDETASIAL